MLPTMVINTPITIKNYGNVVGNMVRIEKPKSVMITIRDRKTNESKSFTVYDTIVDEVYKKVKKIFE